MLLSEESILRIEEEEGYLAALSAASDESVTGTYPFYTNFKDLILAEIWRKFENKNF